MPNPTAAMLVIGDEILSGRTRDTNMHHLATELSKVGIDLREARMVPDAQDHIVAAARALAQNHDHVFTSGGIGPTHDDITADAIAAAFGLRIEVRADARAILTAHYTRSGVELNPARLRMARIPDGAALIENPISAAPGFSVDTLQGGKVHVMAGVPAIFQAMLAGVLPRLTGGAPLLSQSLRIQRPEGEIAGPLGALAARFSDLSLGSYPFVRDGAHGANVVIRGSDAGRVNAGMAALVALFPDGLR